MTQPGSSFLFGARCRNCGRDILLRLSFGGGSAESFACVTCPFCGETQPFSPAEIRRLPAFGPGLLLQRI